MEIIAVKDLKFAYPNASENIIDGISFSVEKGDFIALCGATGSGKSTLLRTLKRELTPNGTLSGDILYKGTPLSSVDDKTAATEIGFVMQQPEQQIVSDKVFHELAFGLENMNVDSSAIRRRIAEIACYFGIEDWFYKNVSELSGGQKQLLNLASIMVMQPKILLLDEPTSQLDPIAASNFISTLAKLNRDLGLTVIIAEHRLEEVIPVSDKLLALENGKIFSYKKTRDAVKELCSHDILIKSMPSAARVYSKFSEIDNNCPLTVSEARDFVTKNFERDVTSLNREKYTHKDSAALEFSDVYFRYGKEHNDVLNGLSFSVYENEIFCLLGGNGAGKSTALFAAAGVNKIYSGNIRVFGKKLKEYKNQDLYKNCLALLPQDVQTVFLRDTVKEELLNIPSDIISRLGISDSMMHSHPYDLSGGEQQLLALSKVLAQNPRLLLLDEPTKGLDAYRKENLINIIQSLKQSGVTVLIVTHDVEFAAECADRCAMLFKGEVVSEGTPHEFFAENSFYTTAVNRITRGYYDGITTVKEAEEICSSNRRYKKL